MSTQEVYDYVMNDPGDTNASVLKSLLDSVDREAGPRTYYIDVNKLGPLAGSPKITDPETVATLSLVKEDLDNNKKCVVILMDKVQNKTAGVFTDFYDWSGLYFSGMAFVVQNSNLFTVTLSYQVDGKWWVFGSVGAEGGNE